MTQKAKLKLEASICSDNERYWGELIALKPDGEEDEILFATGFCDTEDEARDEMKRYLRIAQEHPPSLKDVGQQL